MKTKLSVYDFMKKHHISFLAKKKSRSRFYEIFLRFGKKRVSFISVFCTPSRVFEILKDDIWEEPEFRMAMSSACLGDLMCI